MEREEKQEASISVQGRVNIVALAQIDEYFISCGYRVTSMSQLLNWAIDSFAEGLKNNGIEFVIENITDADIHLDERGLWQRSLKERNKKKLVMAKGFNNLRNEGIDPRTISPIAFNIMHEKNSPEVYEQQGGRNIGMNISEIDRRKNAIGIYKQLEVEDRKKGIAEAIKKGTAALREIGSLAEPEIRNENSYIDTNTDTAYIKEGMSEEDYRAGMEEREKIELAKYKQPIDIEWLKSQGLLIEDKKTTGCEASYIVNSEELKLPSAEAFDNSVVKQDIEQTKSVDDKDERID